MLSIDDLITKQTQADVRSSIMSIAATFDLATTSWNEGSPALAIIDTFAQKVSDTLMVGVVTVAKGVFLDYAASVTPEGGPGWLDILAKSRYGNTRIPAVRAPTTIKFTSTNSPGGTYAAKALHVARGNIVYSNTASIVIPVNGDVSAAFEADVAGAAGSSGQGTITTMITTIAGVVCTNLVAAIGSDAETNANLVVRCRAKLQNISSNGPPGAYTYNATTINGENQVVVSSGPLSQPQYPVTRVRSVKDIVTGIVTTYVAHDAGSYTSPPNYTNNLSKSLASSTNASPIVCTTSSAHGYTTGSTVQITDHLINTGANGSWSIIVLSSTTFSLTGSVGNGVGGATGASYRYSDLDLIDNSIQANAVPLSGTSLTQSATAQDVPIIGVITVTGAAANNSDAVIAANASTAVALLFKRIPIGGVGTANILYLQSVRTAVMNAVGAENVVLSLPAADVAVLDNYVLETTTTPIWTVTRI